MSLDVGRQPDDESCGITCLQSIYRFYGHEISLDRLQNEVEHWRTGGTVNVNLARHALREGFSAEICTYNIRIFDPTWKDLPNEELSRKLKLRQAKMRSKKQKMVIQFYLDFLELGGIIRLDDLNEDLFDSLFAKDRPIIVGLSATYLYQTMRETPNNVDNDIIGQPVGHFVVVSGWDRSRREVVIHDPLRKNPISASGNYNLPFTKFSNAVMLGIITYDENLLIISKK